MKTILAAACGSAWLLSASVASADITFCNHYSSEIWVAVGLPGFNSTLNCDGRFSTDEMIGWYSMTPGNCTTPVSGCVSADWMYFYATAADGAYWAGADLYQKLSYSAFDFCSGTTACYENSCPPFNYGPVGFSFQNIGANNCNIWDSTWEALFDLQ